MNATAEQVALELLEVVPLAMRVIREQMRRSGTAELSVPQFRTLGFLDRHAGASLTDVADHIGLTLPSMSKMIDGLVIRKLVSREFDQADRRRVTLALTARGRTLLQSSRAFTRAFLAERCATLEPNQRARMLGALRDLRGLFPSPRELQPVLEGRNDEDS